MYYLSAYQTGQFGYVHTLATATEWDAWLVTVIPNVLDANVRSRLRSNLKHILVGMEMKAGLITPHATRGAGNASVLFEPYYTVMIFEFCVGAFSVCEGLGTAFRLRDVGNNGANARVSLRTTGLLLLSRLPTRTETLISKPRFGELNPSVTRCIRIG